MKDTQIKEKQNFLLALAIIIFVLLIIIFFYLDRKNQLSSLIQSWGFFGILLAILLMGALCMTPIPSEGFFILLLKIFGIYWGPLYSWLGSILSSFVVYYIGHYFGKGLFQKLITPEHFETVDNWVQERGSIGLLIARILPIPGFIVNYISASIPSIKLWPYVWTAAISMIPYYLGTTMVYVGVSNSTWIWLAVGGAAILIIWLISYSLNKQTKHKKTSA